MSLPHKNEFEENSYPTPATRLFLIDVLFFAFQNILQSWKDKTKIWAGFVPNSEYDMFPPPMMTD